MTKNEAIAIMRAYEKNLYGPKKWFEAHEFRLRSYQRVLIWELVRRMEESALSDPIAIIRIFRSEMDDIMCESEERRTWSFASYMLEGSQDILDLLT